MEYNYTHGGDVYRNPIEYDFSINVNPLGMPLASIQAAHEGVVLTGRYPDYKAEQLCHAIAKAKQIPADRIIPGNGAAELLYVLGQTIPEKALTIAPTFTGYAEAVAAGGGELTYASDEQELLAKMDDSIRLVFLCNPNNPTGTLFTREQILRVLAKAEAMQAYVCVDECFLPFLEEEDSYSMLPYLAEHPRLLVLRAFTKIYCMAGLRLGYLACGDTELQSRIRAKLQPWNTSIPAQLAGIAALSDTEYLAKTRENLQAERAYLVPRLRELMAEVYDGYGNFLLFRDEPDLKERMLEVGVLIRACGDFEGLDDTYFRIGIRSHSENQEFIRRLARVKNVVKKLRFI
ncbi:pyridoxal phosphate-dependent aminotransferase [Wujia sp.]|uniref:pyridoxal phosphate-dependent aminotransferase n=1 Tax=Wujia sp. TaxID=2944172 RepID=UPI003F7FA6D4